MTEEQDVSVAHKEEFAPVIERLSKDMRIVAQRLTRREVRYIVDRYYQSQDDRKRAVNQARAATEVAEPGLVISWLSRQSENLENRIKSLLDIYSENDPLGAWARSNTGIGPVIAAGLLAHIDINKCPNAGHIWSFAGLDSRVIWKNAQDTSKMLEAHFGSRPGIVDEEIVQRACNFFRRNFQTIMKFAKSEDSDKITWTSLCSALARQPWNKNLKTLCWKIGESFVKVSGKEDAYYGRLYTQYRAEEDAKSAEGKLAEVAKAKLANFNIGKTTDAYAHYSSGHLPPAHLYMRAKRRVVKLFLSHYHQVGYELLHKRPAPRPWAIEHGGHSDYIPPPNYTILK